MVDVTLPYEFIGGTKAIAKQVNANFEAVSEGFAGINVELEQLKSEVTKFNNKPLRDSFDIIPSLLGKAPQGAYPLWTGEWIYNARTLFKEFWAKALEYKKAGTIRTLTIEEYDKEVRDYAETGAFVIDELNGHIRLPKIIHFVSGISEVSELGKPANDTLQGHKHTVSGNFAQDGVGGNNLYGFGNYGSRNPVVSMPVSDGTNGEPRIGKYTQPRHIKCALYIQVANNIADISTLNTEVIVEQLNKALADLELKGEEETAKVTTEGQRQIELMGQTINNHLTMIDEVGSDQVNLVVTEGAKQVGLVTQSGSNLVATGDAQIALVTAEGDKQVKRIQAIGTNLQEIGDTQVVRVQTVVAEEVDKKLPEITGKVNEIIAEGNKQIQLVLENGTEQVNLAKAQATAASNSANEAAASAESIDVRRIKRIAYEGQRGISSGANIILTLQDTDEILYVPISENCTISIDDSQLSFTKQWFTVQLRLNFINGARSIGFAGKNVIWINGNTPDFSDGKMHWLVMRLAHTWAYALFSDAGAEG